MNASTYASRITKARKHIDATDTEIVALLNRRVRLALTIGKWKRRAGMPIRNRKREKAVLESVAQKARKPLTRQGVVKIFTEVIRVTRALEARRS